MSDQAKFRLNEINKIKDFFNFEIQERNAMGKILSKHIAVFDYIDKTLFFLPATNGGISIISFTSVIGAPVGIISASFSLMLSLTTGIINNLLRITRNKKTKHNKIAMLAKSKLNIIESLISQALIDLENSHGKLKTIVNEKERYEQMKEHIRNIKSNDERDKICGNSKNIGENSRNV